MFKQVAGSPSLSNMSFVHPTPMLTGLLNIFKGHFLRQSPWEAVIFRKTLHWIDMPPGWPSLERFGLVLAKRLSLVSVFYVTKLRKKRAIVLLNSDSLIRTTKLLFQTCLGSASVETKSPNGEQTDNNLTFLSHSSRTWSLEAGSGGHLLTLTLSKLAIFWLQESYSLCFSL